MMGLFAKYCSNNWQLSLTRWPVISLYKPHVGSGVTQVSAWNRSNMTKAVYFHITCICVDVVRPWHCMYKRCPKERRFRLTHIYTLGAWFKPHFENNMIFFLLSWLTRAFTSILLHVSRDRRKDAEREVVYWSLIFCTNMSCKLHFFLVQKH